MTGDANQMAGGGRRRKLPWPGTPGCLVVLIKPGLCEHCLLFMKPTVSSRTWTRQNFRGDRTHQQRKPTAELGQQRTNNCDSRN